MPTVKLSLTILRVKRGNTQWTSAERGNTETGLRVARLGYIGKFGEGMGVTHCPFAFFGDCAPEIARNGVLFSLQTHLVAGPIPVCWGEVIPVVVLAAAGWRRRWWLVIKLMLIETSFNHKDSVVCCASKPGR